MGLGLSGLRLGLGQRGGGGEPPIITATVDPVLAALTDAQTPADGFTSGTYVSTAGTISSEVAAYLVNGSPELGTYDLAAGDTVRVSETVTDSAANERVFYTTTIVVTPSVALSNTAVPVISGTFEVGQTVSSTQGTWAGSASRTYAYQWLRDSVAISGATSSTYELVEADEGADISCEVTADDGFTQVSAESTAEAVTYPAPVAAGALADQSYTEGAAITPFDTSADFTGSGITYALSPSSAALPTGLSLSSAGVISGTPTATVTGAAIIIRGTNSGGFADSAFSLTVSAAATAPAQFGTGDWSVASGDAQASVTITTLPDDGGATITDVEYQLDGGSWVSSGGTTSFTISSLTNDTTYSVALRAVNSVGSGTASATKAVTPAAGGAFQPSDLFASGEDGALYDLKNAPILYTDSAGTTAVSAYGDPVGRADDESGNAAHLLQATSASRPAWARWPVDGVRNQTYEDYIKDISGSITYTTEVSPPSGYTDARVMKATVTAGTTNISAIRPGTTGQIKSAYYRCPDGQSGTLHVLRHNSFATSKITITDTWQRVDQTITVGEIGGTYWYYADARGDSTYSGIVYCAVPSLEDTTPTTLQLRIDEGGYNVMEPGVADITGLVPDGVDDQMAVTLPSATYTVVSQAMDGTITTLTGQSLGGSETFITAETAFLLVIDRALTAGEQSDLEAYLA